ncbi:hypothetical protein [Vibrio sp. HN007]
MIIYNEKRSVDDENHVVEFAQAPIYLRAIGTVVVIIMLVIVIVP